MLDVYITFYIYIYVCVCVYNKFFNMFYGFFFLRQTEFNNISASKVYVNLDITEVSELIDRFINIYFTL